MSSETKQRVSVEERARRFLATREAPRRDPGDPQDSHAVVYGAACALYQGFGLDRGAAVALLREFCARSDQPWTDAEIAHKVDGAANAGGFMTRDGLQPRGCLLNSSGEWLGKPISTDAQGRRADPAPAAPSVPKVEFDPARLKQMAGTWSGAVDLTWLANRSALDPAQVTATAFLQALYGAQENVLIFTKQQSQGQVLWPLERVPEDGPEGVWFLAQPVDGKYHPNPRSLGRDGNPKMSRRSEESVTAFRYLVLESDTADMYDWLGLLVQIPLRIEAIYTSGGRSIHVLVRVNCATRRQWDDERRALAPTLNFLLLGGADPGALSCVRLTRLPGAMRLGKQGKDGRYTKFEQPKLQKLLYVRPNAPLRALKDMPIVRDVEGFWCGLAAQGIGDADEGEGLNWLLGGLRYYANVSERVREALGGVERAMTTAE